VWIPGFNGTNENVSILIPSATTSAACRAKTAFQLMLSADASTSNHPAPGYRPTWFPIKRMSRVAFAPEDDIFPVPMTDEDRDSRLVVDPEPRRALGISEHATQLRRTPSPYSRKRPAPSAMHTAQRQRTDGAGSSAERA